MAKQIFKIIFGVFLCYHLLVVALMPNSSSLITKTFQSIILPYANAIAFNVSWQFFSPDPANTMYIQYRVFFENEFGEEVKESVSGIYPTDQGGKTDIQSRRVLYSMRFFVMDLNRLKYVFAPYLCRENQGATRVVVEHVIEPIPALEAASLMSQTALEASRQKLKMPSVELSCLEHEEVEF